MPTPDASPGYFDATVDEALKRQPDLAWVRPGLARFGWGVAGRHDPGTGPDRFARARSFSETLGDAVAFAAFTFDEDSPGSVVIAPETVLTIEGGYSMTSGGPLPPPAQLSRIPEMVDQFEEPGIWLGDVELAMRAIDSGDVDKVVLSRHLDLVFASDVPVPTILARLVAEQSESHSFRVGDFVGSSPELLVGLADGSVRSLSLAGSAAAGGDVPAELGTEKMATEHDLAADSVEDALAPLCTDLDRKPRQITTYGEIAHLATSFAGQVRPGTTVLDVVAELHPTAAVAGNPTKKAVELIREIETHDRGLYAGPVGWLDSRGNGEFAIALRCGEAQGRRLRLYAGAGLVAGSDPAAELEETTLKLRPMLSAITR